MNDGSGTMNGTSFNVAEAAHHGDERTTLLGVLQRQRDLVAWKLEQPFYNLVHIRRRSP